MAWTKDDEIQHLTAELDKAKEAVNKEIETQEEKW